LSVTLDPWVAEYEPNGFDLIRHGVRVGVDLLHARRWRGRDVCSADPLESMPGLRLDGPRTVDAPPEGDRGCCGWRRRFGG
jgi:hypothetical protein